MGDSVGTVPKVGAGDCAFKKNKTKKQYTTFGPLLNLPAVDIDRERVGQVHKMAGELLYHLFISSSEIGGWGLEERGWGKH